MSKNKSVPSRLSLITKAAEAYGDRSFQNYSIVRNVAETVRDTFCKFLDEDRQCVYLVGVLTARAYQFWFGRDFQRW